MASPLCTSWERWPSRRRYAIAQGDKVAVEAESFAELVNGKVYQNKYHFLFEIRDGQIYRVKEYMDTMHAYQTFYA